MSCINPLPYCQDHNPGGFPAVLLLHGLGTTSDCWQFQVPALTGANLRVLAPDLPGFGRSPRLSQRMSIAALAGQVAELLKSATAAPAHVVGISMGGTVALQLAVDHPELVRRLVLVSTFARLRPQRPTGWLAFASRLALAYVLGLPSQANAISQRVFPKPDQQPLRDAMVAQILQSDPRAYRSAILALGRFDVRSRLAQIRRPTLIVTGSDDTTVSPANQRELLAIPGSQQVILPGAGHGLIADHPAEFNRVLLQFLQEV